jgi:segregation and condensation protein A
LRIELDGFEGPLDLLLHLIRKHELDILDIPIAFVTEEYLAYLDAMGELDLAVAGEYLVMAATLLHIKSKLLLPRPPSDDDDAGEDGDVLDPREELVRRLLEYQRYRSAAEQLGERELDGRDVFRRPSRADRLAEEAGPRDLVPVDLFHLLDAFRRLLEDKPAEALHEVTPESLTLRDTINAVADYLAEHPRCTLEDLTKLSGANPGRGAIVVTFLALLEMAKLRLIKLFQSRLTSNELFIERAVIDPGELAQRLSGLDATEDA